MKMPVLLLITSFFISCADKSPETELLSISVKGDPRRKSVIYAEIVQDLQTELHRTRSEHKQKEQQTKCRVIAAFLTATASAAAGVISVVYAISSCTDK